MSAPSSSGSWSGEGCAAPDIIDLDKFMRGAVRPSRRHDGETRNSRCGKFVVDAGGFHRKIPPGSGAPALPEGPYQGGAPMKLHQEISSSSISSRPPQVKRFSHDSGLSDLSYAKRKHRPHRRSAVIEPSRGGGSTSSLRAFRAVCERTLLDQQAQIARVAQLCEKLTEVRHPPATPRPTSPSRPAPPSRPLPPSRRSDTMTSHTSDTTSTSQSTRTRELRRKDKHRTEECKTYKIIMNKLDELNRLFASRAHSPGVVKTMVRPSLPVRRSQPTSDSVSVSDKFVSTEPALLQTARATPASRRSVRAVTNTCTLDIAPRPPQRRNVLTESVMGYDSGEAAPTAYDARCEFDLEDPIHLFMQAQHLRATPTATRRSRSVGACDGRLGAADGAHGSEHAGAHVGKQEPRGISLCAMCRRCWRSLRQYIWTQIFSTENGGQ